MRFAAGISASRAACTQAVRGAPHSAPKSISTRLCRGWASTGWRPDLLDEVADRPLYRVRIESRHLVQSGCGYAKNVRSGVTAYVPVPGPSTIAKSRSTAAQQRKLAICL